MTNGSTDAVVECPPAAQKSALEGVPVTFSDLRYTVPAKKKSTYAILSGVSGHFEPGRLTALMGPSGSGKTTLMDILAGRKTSAGKLEGEVLFGGNEVPKSALRHLCGYVEQFDTLVGELTVEQMLMYTAELKLPRSLGRDGKRHRVDEVIDILRLEKCRSTVIGNQLRRGISGGQAKRVNVALALVTRPKIVFLDEPTSGLDSRMANELCALLKNLAKEGATVIATVHSPTSLAFSFFDDLFMLQAGGRLIYDGPVADARAHFESMGNAFPEDKGYSLPDWLVDTTSGPGGEALDQPDKEPMDFATFWEEKKAGQRAEARRNAVAALKSSPADLKSLPTKGPGQLWALWTLLAYRMSTHYRSGEFLGPRFGDKIFMSVLTLSLYWGIGDKTDAQSIQSVAAALYFFAALCGYGAAAFVPSLTLERPLFYRERADGCYTAVAYYMSKFVEEAVLCTLTSLTFSAIVFFAMRLQGSFIVFAAAYFLTSMVGIVLAYAVAAFAPTMEAANALLPTYVTTCMYFGGLFLVFDKIPDGWYWYSWSSFLRYAWGAMMINQFKDQHTGQISVFYNDAGASQNIMEFYALHAGVMNNLGACLGILAGICLLFGALGAVLLTFVSHVKR
mmetsp:Transcript_90016/g.280160  ORF Transcript_90016/g.280160 Transcript_90016/m.280160 type:complete len:621 (+) Transcript_90016:92-1954(+)